MPETKTSTRPSRKRVETAKVEKPKPEKKAPKAAEIEPEAVETPEAEEAVQRIRVIMEHKGDTKTYSKWQPPAASGCVGTYYAPLGTKVVKVLLEGPAS